MRLITKSAVYPIGALVALSVGAAAHAQTTAAPAASDATGGVQSPPNDAQPAPQADIVVTGSRIGRSSYTSESPIVSVGQDAVSASGSPTIETTLNQLPQLSSSASTSANFSTRAGQASADLRGLGQQRTLVLIDGRRMQPSGSDGSIDLNLIPTALIDNVEVITGGASAVYGSDAVTGVVNFKLRKNVDGVELSGQYGVSGRGDGATKNLNLLFGGPFSQGKGHVVFDLDYSQRDAVNFTDRKYLLGQFTSSYTPDGKLNTDATNLPSQAEVNAIFAKYGVAPGTVSRSTPFGFNADGTLFNPTGPVHYTGQYNSVIGVYQGALSSFTGNYLYAQTPLKRYNGFASTDYEISPHIKLFAQAMYSDDTVTSRTAPATVGSNTSTIPLTVPVTNPFIPADLAQLLASRAQPNAPFTIVTRLSPAGDHMQRFHYSVYQFQAGASGDYGAGDWKWSVDGSIGRTDLTETDINYQSSTALNQLLQAPDGGASICSGGLNLFGQHPISAACIAYVNRTPQDITTLQQQIVEVNTDGTLFHLPAGPVKIAIGADYRRNSFSFNPDTSIASGDIAGYLPISSSHGATDVKEIYAEGLIPILRDTFLFKELNVDLAYRYSDYESVGGTSTYKADVDWKMFDGLRLRGGYSRAVRAPSVGELFAPQTQSQATLGSVTAVASGDPCDVRSAYRAPGAANAGQVRSLCLAQGVPMPIIDSYNNTTVNNAALSQGNPDLKAEIADTYSVGAVLTPHFSSPLFSRVNFSVDYYNISLKGAIGTITNLLATQRCFNADGSNPTYSQSNYYCSLISRDHSNGLITLIQNPLFNLGGYKTSGIDVTGDWAFDLDALGLKGNPGRLSISTDINYLISFDIQTVAGGPSVDYAGTILNTQIDPFADAHPHWKATSAVTYTLDPISLSLRWRYIGGMENAANVGTGGKLPPVEAVSYFDLDAGWSINNRLRLLVGIDNLFDRDPPIVNQSVAGGYQTDIYTYDIIGRRFFAQVKAKF
jgi:outer membrane receptor protein involved in Fe transport